jgi:TonB family protein
VHFGIVFYFILNPPKQKQLVSGLTAKELGEDFADVTLAQGDEATGGNFLLMDEQKVISDMEQFSSSKSQQIATQKDPVSSELRGGRLTGEESGGGGIAGDADQSGQRSSIPGSRSGRSQNVENEISDQGILSYLGDSQGKSGSSELDQVLGEGSDGIDQQVYQNIDKMTKSGGAKGSGGGGSGSGMGGGTGDGGQRGVARGGRTTQGGNIDTMVTGLGSAVAVSSPKRQTDLMITELSPINKDGEQIDGKALTLGGRDINEVSSIVYAHSSAIQYCYERELKRNPDLKGKIVVRFTILPSGKVKDPRIISSTVKNERVERCVLSRISRWDDFGAIDSSLGNATFRQVYTFGF